jgi:carbonic anhydrase
MSDQDKQPKAATAGVTPQVETAEMALQHIVDGFKHFRHDVFPQQEELFKKLATAQHPRAMFITCADSRIVPELITQSSPGDLFVTRNVGNVVPPYGPMNGGVSTAIEYAVLALGVQHIIVCGHSDCGAMRAVLNPDTLEKMPTVKAWLRHAEVAKTVVQSAHTPFRGVQTGQRSAVHPWLGLRHRNQRNPRIRCRAGLLPAAGWRPSGAHGVDPPRAILIAG